MTLHNAEVNDMLRRLNEWATDMEVVDYDDSVTEHLRGGAPSGELTETITIHWRRHRQDERSPE